MEYEIDTSKSSINWNASDEERILQNVLNLINTWKNEVAYARDKGIDTRCIDKANEDTAALYISEVYRVIEEYEPRATVKSVDIVSIDKGGNMQFKVVVEIE